MDIEKTVGEFVSKRFLNDGDAALSDEDSLLESGILDSAGIFELVTFLENQFGIAVDDEEIIVDNFDNIAKISGMVRSKQG